MKYLVYLVLFLFACSSPDYEREVKNLFIKKEGIEPIVLSIEIDSLLEPDSISRIAHKRLKELPANNRSMLDLYKSWKKRAEQGLERDKNNGIEALREFDVERIRDYETQIRRYEKELLLLESGKHPEADSLKKLIKNPFGIHFTTVKYKMSEASPILVRNMIFTVGDQTSLIHVDQNKK